MAAPLPRRLALTVLILGSLSAMPVGRILAQGAPMPATLFLRPHCELTQQEQCPAFDVQDPTTLITPPLPVGSTFDIDVMLKNPNAEAIRAIRVWLSYDTTVLAGSAVSVDAAFPYPVPGQVEFAPESGFAKAAASAAEGKEPSTALLPVARMSFTVKNVPAAGGTPISFYDAQATTTGHTFVVTAASPQTSMLALPLGSLFVAIAGAGPSTTVEEELAGGTVDALLETSVTSRSGPDGPSGPMAVPSVPSIPSSSSTSSTTSTPTVTTFERIQVQNVRVSTLDDRLYITWDPLSHPKLQGFNVYYGTQPGQYIQRRSVSIAARGTVVRDVPKGTTYYVAVRGVDDANRESAYSPEVSVEIGAPSTATAPINGSLDIYDQPGTQAVAPENPLDRRETTLHGDVPGSAGTHSALALLLLGSAAIGTLLAFRRQVTASVRPPRP